MNIEWSWCCANGTLIAVDHVLQLDGTLESQFIIRMRQQRSHRTRRGMSY